MSSIVANALLQISNAKYVTFIGPVSINYVNIFAISGKAFLSIVRRIYRLLSSTKQIP